MHYKKHYLSMVLFFLFIAKSFAIKVKGTIIIQGEEKEVYIDIPIKLFGENVKFRKIQKHFYYYNNSFQQIKINADDVEEVRFRYDDQEFRMISVYDNIKLSTKHSPNGKIFLKLMEDGPLRMYEYFFRVEGFMLANWETGASSGTLDVVKKYILQKNEGELTRFKEVGFRIKMAGYVSECEDLAYKISSKQYIADNIRAIVSYYNTSCD